MKYRICINMPVEKETVERILDATAQAGAGNIGAYSRVAMVMETWRSEEGAHPYNGVVREVTVAKPVRLEMKCPEDKVGDAIKVVRAFHPYEVPVIELV